MISLNGKHALVSGGSRGIGAATAMLLAQAGADVGIAYRSRHTEADAVVGAIRALGRRAFAYAADLSSVEANDAFVQRGCDEFGGVDIFVGNSGVWPPVPVAVEYGTRSPLSV